MTSLYWHTCGEGKRDLVLLHGWGLNAEVWQSIIPRLSAHYRLHLVDLPGYGWARVSRTERNSWQSLVEGYLAKRSQLCLAILLQDVRRDLSEDETLLLDWLAEREINALLVFTKADKLKTMQRKKRVAALRAQLGERSIPNLVTSSQKRQGLDELWRAIRERTQAWEALADSDLE